jgi:CelD/BcsL family acetyltransferase involved in cellulose biosynthesis
MPRYSTASRQRDADSGLHTPSAPEGCGASPRGKGKKFTPIPLPILMPPEATLAITLTPVTDWTALGERWQDLESRTDASFFQTWTWIGCLAAERYDDPVLLEARCGGRVIALGLFNRRRGWPLDTLWLHETGVPQLDSVYIEYNGLLIDAECSAGDHDNHDALRAACLAAARHAPLRGQPLGRRVILNGVDCAHLRVAAAVGTVSGHTTGQAPALDLAALRRNGLGHEDVLSANTRAQLRRSLRGYATLGALAVQAAPDAAQAHRFLDELASLHQATWQRRGRTGAFSEPHFARFHHALIDRALPRGEVELWRVSAGPSAIGYLYNFQHRGRVLAYQSGFDYRLLADRRAKPGLTCHHLVIEKSLTAQRIWYDFLAGDDRYKRSLSDTKTTLHWLTLGPLLDPARLAAQARGLVRAALRGV